ncbi:MAG: PhoU domain-containing protein [Thermoplasmata archaeon]
MDNVERCLLDMKNNSELMLDLAYSALLYHNRDIAKEVVELEDTTDQLYETIQKKALEMCEKGDAKNHALLLIKLADSIERIADSALDIADVVLRDIDLHPALKKSLEESDVVVLKKRVEDGSKLCDRSLGVTRLASETGMWVIAVKRKNKWIYGPTEKTVLKAGDIIFTRGPEDSESILEKWVKS